MVKNLEIRLCIRSAYGTKKGLPVKSRKPLVFLVELRRFERPTPSVRGKCSPAELQPHCARKMERKTGLEPATYGLEGHRSTN